MKIACITGTRADYPRVRSVLREISKRNHLELDIIVTGSHLLEEYGLSKNEIIDDGFDIFDEVVMYEDNFDSPYGMAKAAATCSSGLADSLYRSSPDLVLLTVDRVETLAAAMTTSLMNFPIAHIQGGEVTGTIDESIRHAVTKLSHIHFAATEDAKQRILNMGEVPGNVHNTGCPYIDEIKISEFKSKDELCMKYGLDTSKKQIIFTQHSVTTEYGSSLEQINITLEALKILDNSYEVVCFFSNADAGGKSIIDQVSKESNFILIPNMVSNDFLSLMKYANLMIGNSSAGIREAPSFELPVINIGSRQNGRLRASNVIDVSHDTSKIKNAIKKVLDADLFKKSLKGMKNPYGDGNAAKKIVDIIENTEITTELIQKMIHYE